MQQINQVAVDAAVRSMVRADQVFEDAMLQINLARRELDGTIARLTGRETVQCQKCRVQVDVTKVHQKDRCMDRACPLKPQETQS